MSLFKGLKILAVVLSLLSMVHVATPFAQQTVRVRQTTRGSTLQVDGKDVMVFGMNWDYFPIGTNYSFSLWNQPDDFVKTALDREMSLMKAMGVNAIRVYNGMPPRWVEYVYDTYGIYTVMNHPMARYGFLLDGTWTPNVDYSNPRLRNAVKAEIVSLVEEFRGTRGILMWLLGNENNYGLSWSSFEIEALPKGERQAARARYLYTLFDEVAAAIKRADNSRPVAMCNGDIQYIDIIAEECNNIDIYGTNVYRGISVRDLYQVVKDKLDIPVVFTEFGCDAFNARAMREDQAMQCRYLVGQWQEIYEQSAGKGRVGNSIGGMTFQWSDGWWKFRQEENLDIHDTNASWPNGGYPEDFVEGENNMNEEWWGITAKGYPDAQGHYNVYPRAAYYALQKAYELDPYAPTTSLETIRAHFASISAAGAELQASGATAALKAEQGGAVKVTNLRFEFETYHTQGSNITTPGIDERQAAYPQYRGGLDRLESAYIDFEAKPTQQVIGRVSLNILGNVPVNPIDEIFYENRGRTYASVTRAALAADSIGIDSDTLNVSDAERVKLYRASLQWQDKYFELNAFYRVGHLHWQYEGDFFGLYRDAYYGENIDIYNGNAPIGAEIAFKRRLEGLKIAIGPELWWGANPAIVGKYQRQLGPVNTTIVFHEDVGEPPGDGFGTAAATSTAIPEQRARKVSLQGEMSRGPFTLTAGGLWAGSRRIDNVFHITDLSRGTTPLIDSVQTSDTFGGRARLSFSKGRVNWYAQGTIAGIVASAGPTALRTNFTEWRLKDPGTGNQNTFLTGATYQAGNFQIAPNFLWQKPMVGPIAPEAVETGETALRNQLDDPFYVRANRETVGYEMIVTYDPTPATWFWQWDNDIREDAPFAAALGLVYQDFKTTMDAALYVSADGSVFPFLASTPERSLWEAYARIVSSPTPSLRLIANAFAGEAEPTGDDPRLIERFGADARVSYGKTLMQVHAKFDDFGPYDYHRDFNLTYPEQYMIDIARTVGTPGLLVDDLQTKIGLRFTYRGLNEFSPRYCPGLVLNSDGEWVCDETAVGPDGSEWEFRSYLHFSM